VKQTLSVEWLVVTPFNGSLTQTYAAQLYSSGIIKKIIADEGLGVYPAMNRALAEIDDQNWIWFMNSGDLFPNQETYLYVKEFISQTKKRWIYGGHFLASECGDLLGEIQAPKNFKLSNQLFSKNYISHQSAIFHSKFIKELDGFRTDLKIAGDWDLMARASQIDSGQRMPETISIFYMGGVSTTSRQVGNKELLSLRNHYLSKIYVPKSYWWFFYRALRNYFVRLVEMKLPKFANHLRRFRFKIVGKQIK
jgi:hypothetical protein